MIRAVGYIRVSSEEQAASGFSLDAQRAKLTAYAALYDIELVSIQVDAGISAKTLDRPGLQTALGMLQFGEVEAFVVVKLDRLTRSVRDLDVLIEKYFATRFTLMSVGEQIDTRTAGGRLILNILGSVSQWEREAIGERTSAALQHKKAEGQHCGSAGFGFKMVEKKLTKIQTEHETIAIIQKMKAQGRTLQSIADYLNDNGFQTQRGGKWYPTTIANILKRGAGESTRVS